MSSATGGAVSSPRGRWYGADLARTGSGRKVPDGERGAVQTTIGFRRHYGWPEGKTFTLPLELLRIAGDEYEAQGYSQTFERLQERGGFGILELIALLADAAERAKADHVR